jgi:hypothetical protein
VWNNTEDNPYLEVDSILASLGESLDEPITKGEEADTPEPSE